MRKITLFFIFVGGIMFAQQPQSYLELLQSKPNE